MAIDDAQLKNARQAWLRALKLTSSLERRTGLALPTLIGELADRHESAPALISDEATFTYRGLADRCNQYAHWGIAQGLKRADTVFLLMPNRAEYLAVWLGLTRIGVVVALGNTNLSGDSLAHAVRIVDARLVLVDAALVPALLGAALPAKLPCRVLGPSSSHLVPLEHDLHCQSADALSEIHVPAPALDSTALYIYTSGTTGLPKAARVSHYRLLQWSHWFAGLMDTGIQDRMYNCLPLYHSVGGVVATGATLVAGGAVVIRRRFSASEFWQDIGAMRCTLFQYIGELCRYLVNQPFQAAEHEHVLRLACGNGLRPEIWGIFASRFRVPRILEYYAATEGNVSLYNCEGEPGSIGRIPPFLGPRPSVELIRFDVDSGEPSRDADGWCVRCARDEIGEAIGFIPSGSAARTGRFEGYVDVEATERKILRNVFEPGDAWYRTGDLMRRDARGYYYFIDRVGETYRWKGENVSTMEVMSVLTTVQGVIDGVVYGVHVPGADGRAGMAALLVDDRFGLTDFNQVISERLPYYARPSFLRLLPGMEATGTFKPIKRELIRCGFDPSTTSDRIFFYSKPAAAFIPMDGSLYASIAAGTVRL